MSLERLVSVPKAELPVWFTEGQYNSVPPNFKELTEKEFAHSEFFIYGFSHYEFRQVVWKGQAMDLRLFYLLGRPEGFAIEHDYWKGEVRYFRFTNCIHKYIEVSRAGMEALAAKFPQLKGKGTWGNCCHNSVCEKCGDYRFLDSSD